MLFHFFYCFGVGAGGGGISVGSIVNILSNKEVELFYIIYFES